MPRHKKTYHGTLWLPKDWGYYEEGRKKNIIRLTPAEWRVRMACIWADASGFRFDMFNRWLRRAIEEYGYKKSLAALDKAVGDPAKLMLPENTYPERNKWNEEKYLWLSIKIIECIGHFVCKYGSDPDTIWRTKIGLIKIIRKRYKIDPSYALDALEHYRKIPLAGVVLKEIHRCYLGNLEPVHYSNMVGFNGNIIAMNAAKMAKKFNLDEDLEEPEWGSVHSAL